MKTEITAMSSVPSAFVRCIAKVRKTNDEKGMAEIAMA
jgi:hypothetical protein